MNKNLYFCVSVSCQSNYYAMDIDLISDEFRLHQPNRYSLWLYLSDTSCSVSILDDAEKIFVGIKYVKNISLTKTIELFDELTAIPFSRVTISVDANPSLLVPQALYRSENKKDLLGFSADLNDEHEIVSHHLSALSVVCLFSISKSFQNFVTPYFPKATILHISGALLVAVDELSRSVEKGITMGVRIADHTLHVCIFNFGKLLFSNHFSTHTNEDLVYWILRVCEQFSINPSKLKLYIDGIENAMDEKSIVLKPYFNKISKIPFPPMYTLSQELRSTMPAEIDLFYLPLCES